MKKSILLVLGLAMTFTTEAQLKTPAPSPTTTIKQTVGLTNFELTYSRPSLRGRDMHKEIIPYGAPWRFGANKNTVITFDTPVVIESVPVTAGTYAIFAVPNKGDWMFVLYKDAENWGMPAELDKEKIAAEIKAKSIQTKDKVETFTISFDQLNDVNKFTLNVAWENTRVPLTVELPTAKLAEQSIKETLDGKPTHSDYFRAGMYYLGSDKNLDMAAEYLATAVKLNNKSPYYYDYNTALAYQKIGKNKEALHYAESTVKKASDSKNEEYTRKGKMLIEELGK